MDRKGLAANLACESAALRGAWPCDTGLWEMDTAMSSGGKTYKLSEILDIKAAVPLAEGLLAQRGQELLIDASRVERLGAQSLQILLSAISTWRADGVAIEFVAASEPFIQSLTLLGIDPETFLNAGQVPLSATEAH